MTVEYFDTPATLFYCDPPYVPETWATNSAYAKIMNDKEHCELLETLKNIRGMAIISGYNNELYAASLRGWTRKTKMEMNQRRKPREECIWLSPRASQLLAAQTSLLPSEEMAQTMQLYGQPEEP